MTKCVCCETPIESGRFCPDCTKQMTYFERLQIMKLADIGFMLTEINARMGNMR